MIEKTEFESGTFYLGDCFEVMAALEAGSVDMILADLPYGTTACAWDSALPLPDVWNTYFKINKSNAAIVLTASQPFTTALIASQIKYFKYSLIWDKLNRFTGAPNAKKRPMKQHEDICVFYKEQPIYNPQFRKGVPYSTSRKGGNGQYIDGLREIEDRPQKSDGTKAYPGSIIAVHGAFGPIKQIHPTQKPIPLFEYLIRTYTNEGELVLDNTAGSGTTAIAAMNAGRRWICIEKDETYYRAAVERVRKHEEKMREAA